MIPIFKVSDSYIVSEKEYGDSSTEFCTFPSLTRCSDGSFLCCMLAGLTKTGPEGRIRLYRSTDNLKSWHQMSSPALHDESNSPEYGYMMCHICEINTGCLLAVYARVQRFDPEESLFHPLTDGIQYSEVRITKSFDGGMNWTQPKTLDYRHPDIIVPGKVLKLPGGSLGMPCEIWHEWDKGFREGPSSRLIISHDDGNTWNEASIMAKDEFKESIYGDPRLAVFDDGRIMTMFWRYSIKNGEDMPVHIAYSGDCGNNWTIPASTGIMGQIASPVVLKENHVLCIYQERFDNPGLKVVSSHDGGKSWDLNNTSLVWQADSLLNSKNPFQGYLKYSFGYSSVIKLSDVEILVVFWRNINNTTCIQILDISLI